MKINLLPPEIKERQAVRRRTVLVSGVGVAVVALLAALFVLQQIRLTDVRADLEAQQQANAQLEGEIAELQRFGELQANVQSSRALLTVLRANEVLWSGVLRDVSLVIPGTAWLTGMNGAIVTDEAQAGAAAQLGEGLVGQIGFNGFAFDHRSVALWLSRLEDVEGFANPWLSTSQSAEIGTQEVVSFQSSVDLSADAVSRRGRQAP